MTLSNCKICHKGLREVEMEGKRALVCRNPMCEGYGAIVEVVHRPKPSSPPVGKRKKR